MIFTTSALYLVWHVIATLGWPSLFSPSLWPISILMVLTIVATLHLLTRHIFLAHLVWHIGLIAAVLLALHIYQQPEITLLLAILPLMSITTAGPTATILVESFLLLAAWLIPQIVVFPIISPGYSITLVLASLFTAFTGWGISTNLYTALSSSSYHFNEARHLLEETRQHRGEISRMLKEGNQANYQLERLNEMLSFARKQADEARDDRDRFVLAVSHELRSPLNFILGFSDMMVKSPETYAPRSEWPAGLYEDISEIYRSSTHLLSLINDILDLGQVDARQMTLYRENVHIESMICEVRDMLTPAYRQKGLWLKTEIAPHLPPLQIDATRIRQVLINLTNNAVRFTHQGGATIRAEQVEGDIQISIQDTGSGIAFEDQPKVFSEFRQVGHDSWRRHEGSGLGLAISRRFVELHGGRIWFDSKIGQGSTFYFTLPIVEIPTGISLSESLTSDQPVSLRERPAVLVSSQNPLAGGLLQQCLPEYLVVPLENDEDLPDLVETHFPRALLVDRETRSTGNLPTQDLPYDLPVINLSLPGETADSELPSGVFAYLTKPVSRSTLETAVNSLSPAIRRLLVVDDDPAMLRFLTQALRSRPEDPAGIPQYTFFTAQTGEQAVRMLAEQEVDAILLDLDLPDINGWQLLERVQTDELLSQKPILIISALDRPQVLLSRGQEVIELRLKRTLSQQELAPVLQSMIGTIQPFYTRPASNPPPRLRS